MAANGPCLCCKAETDQFVNGWMLKNGSLAQLCSKCGFAYVNGIFCETFHKEVEGWRGCGLCGKPLHCGCLISSEKSAPLDFGGIGCTKCLRVLDKCNAPGGMKKLLKEIAEKYKTDPMVSSVPTAKVPEFLSPGSLQAPAPQFGEESNTNATEGDTTRQTIVVRPYKPQPCRPLIISPEIMEALRPLPSNPSTDYSRTLVPIGTNASVPHRNDQPKSQEPDNRNGEIIVREPKPVGPSSAVTPSQVEIEKGKGKRLEFVGGEKETAKLQIPKKIKLLVDDFLRKIVDVTTSLEQAEVLGYNLTPKSLGLVDTPSGLLVPAAVFVPKVPEVKVPKKRGRPFGSKNKPKPKEVPADEVLSVPAGEASSSLAIKGRGSGRGRGQGQRKGKEKL